MPETHGVAREAAQDSYRRLPVEQILVERDARQRRDLEVQDLKASIRQIGILTPLLVRQDGDEIWLVAGERRLEAARQLGLPDIPVRFLHELSPLELQIIELEENVKRQELPWRDLVQATGRVHSLYGMVDEGWNQVKTAQALSLSEGNLSLILRVYADLDSTVIAKSTTIREAYNALGRQDQRRNGDLLQELLDQPEQTEGLPGETLVPALARASGQYNGTSQSSPSLALTAGSGPRGLAPEPVLCAEFLTWARRYSGPKFNLLHLDFPYGVNVFGGDGQFTGVDASGYDDAEDVYWGLLEGFLEVLPRLISVSAHLMFWYSEKHGARTRALFSERASFLEFEQFPLIWVKSDNAGIAAKVNRSPRHIYETCLLASRGGRQLVRVASDAYSAPTDKRLHPSCKPEPVLRHFMGMLVDGGTELLDPTCGSGSALRAADSLGAKRVLGLERDESYARSAKQALEAARKLRAAELLSGPGQGAISAFGK